MKKFIKSSISTLVPFYSLTWIYVVELPSCMKCSKGDSLPSLPSVPDSKKPSSKSASNSLEPPLLWKLLEMPGPGGFSFGITHADVIVSSCEAWAGRSYHEPSIWALGDDEALLTRLQTDVAYRGLGLASQLLTHLEREMACDKFQRLYAVVWWTNSASIKAFSKARWARVAFSVRIRFWFSKHEICWRFPLRAGIRYRAAAKKLRDDID